MKNKWLRFVIIGTVTASCLIGVSSCLSPRIRYDQPEEVSRCSPPSATFSEETLAGTWIAGSSGHMDTLIIKTDGTYKQVVHVDLAEGPPIDYESDWQTWYLEYSKDNIPYIHLTGYRFCGMNTDIPCNVRDGDGHDFCRNEYVPMNGEGILIVLETPNEHYYYLHYPLGSENSYMYRFQGP